MAFLTSHNKALLQQKNKAVFSTKEVNKATMAPTINVLDLEVISEPPTPRIRTRPVDYELKYHPTAEATSNGEIAFESEKSSCPPYEHDKPPFSVRATSNYGSYNIAVPMHNKVTWRIGNECHSVTKDGTGQISGTIYGANPMGAKIFVFDGSRHVKTMEPLEGRLRKWGSAITDIPIEHECDYLAHPNAEPTTPQEIRDCPLSDTKLGSNIAIQIGRVSHHFQKSTGPTTLLQFTGKFIDGDFAACVDGRECADPEFRSEGVRQRFLNAVSKEQIVSISLMVTHNDGDDSSDSSGGDTTSSGRDTSGADDDDKDDDDNEQGPGSSGSDSGDDNNKSPGSGRGSGSGSGSGNKTEGEIWDDFVYDFKSNCDGSLQDCMADFAHFVGGR